VTQLIGVPNQEKWRRFDRVGGGDELRKLHEEARNAAIHGLNF
jgi:hypothetical protein